MIGLAIGAVLAVLAVGVWAALSGGTDGEAPGVAVAQPVDPTTTIGDVGGGSSATTPPVGADPGSDGSAAADPEPGGTPGAEPGTEPDRTVETGPGVLDELRCETARYSVVVPPSWSEHECERFSPSTLGPDPGDDVRPEIDLAWVTSETYDQAVARVETRFTVLDRGTATAGGRDATVYVLEEEIGGETGRRMVYVVDAPGGVFFSSANELVRGVGTINRPLLHYRATVLALEAMMASVRF